MATGAAAATLQSRIVLSREAVTTSLPSDENAAELTQSWCPPSTATWAPLSAFQIRAVLSVPAVTMQVPVVPSSKVHRPSGENCASSNQLSPNRLGIGGAGIVNIGASPSVFHTRNIPFDDTGESAF